MNMKDRITHAWNAFMGKDKLVYRDYGISSGRPLHKTYGYYNPKSYVSSIYNRIALDASMTTIKHVKVDPDTEDEVEVNSGLNNCLTTEANIDQTHIQLIHDIVYSMFDEGVVAVVPVDISTNPETGFDVLSLRVAKILTWHPKHIEVDLYNEDKGQNERIILAKSNVAIIENPMYSVINDENSTLKRLIRKSQQLDELDRLSASGRLDLLISVPYVVKTETQKKMAENRIRDIENQLARGRNGIAYIDGTEKAHQLNRPVNDQLPETIDRLNTEFHNQLGLTKNILDGTAREEEMRAYYTRTIDPVLDNIVAEFNRKFFTKTSRTRGNKIIHNRDLFKMIPIESISSLGDSLRRNYVATPNEIRKIVGLRRSNDPRADELFNPNIADDKQNIGLGGIPDTSFTERKNEQKKIHEKRDSEEEEKKILEKQTHMTRREREDDKKMRKEN